MEHVLRQCVISLHLGADVNAGRFDAEAVDDLVEDGGQPRRAHLRQDRRVDPRARQLVRDAARVLPEEQFATPSAIDKMGQTPHVTPPTPIYGEARRPSTANAEEES